MVTTNSWQGAYGRVSQRSTRFDCELLNGFETGKPHPRAYTVTVALDWKHAGRTQSPSSIGVAQGFTRERLSPPGAEAITAVNYTPREFINLINASTLLAVSMQALETDLHSHSDKERWFYPLKTQCPVISWQSLSQKLVRGPAQDWKMKMVGAWRSRVSSFAIVSQSTEGTKSLAKRFYLLWWVLLWIPQLNLAPGHKKC